MMKAGILAVAALVACCTLATSASAQSPAEAKCRDTIAKSLGKYVKTYNRAVAECHAARSSGQLPLSTDCNSATGADAGGKIARAAAKFKAVVGGSANRCLGADALLDAQYPECPAPAATVDDGGATNGIDSFSELAVCLLALTDAAMESGLDEGVGQPAEVLQPPTAQCQQTLSSSLSRLVGTIMKVRRKCQRTLDKQNVGLDYSCDGADPKGKIGRARVALNAAIDAGCDLPQSELAKINACSDTTVGLRQCVGDDVGVPLGSVLIRNAYELPGGGSPTTTTTTVGPPTTTVGPTTTTTLSNACGNTFPACGGDCPGGTLCTNTGALCQCQSTGGCAPATILRRYKSQLGDYPADVRATQLSTGWSGTAHDIDIPGDGNSADAVNVNCNANCENCSINLNPLKDTTQPYCRCNNDPLVACDTINGADADDCGSINNGCTCYFGGPLGISAGGTPVCAVNKIKSDFNGTMNLRSGEWYDTADLISVVHLGASVTAPCPTCEGDTTPNDGVRNGTCAGGIGAGPCDVNATHPTFGPVSFDCPPNTATNVSGNGLQIKLKFSTAGTSLAATLPCSSPLQNLDCPCRVCSADGTLGCSSDAECQAAGAGACTAAGGAGVKPNECNDLTCSAQGRCDGGPLDTFCDGTTHSDGRGFISCVGDADCTALGEGTCTISEKRRCYTDPIVVQGSPDPVDPVRGSVFCIPPTTSAAVNNSGGLPGPGTFELEFASDIRCQNDPNVPYQLPDGANCGVVATTTTTTNPVLACADSTPPLCAGACNGIATCVESAGACVCQAPPACGGTFPLCSGACATGQACLPDLTSQSCLCTVVQ